VTPGHNLKFHKVENLFTSDYYPILPDHGSLHVKIKPVSFNEEAATADTYLSFPVLNNSSQF
jgi:hypothetical protein